MTDSSPKNLQNLLDTRYSDAPVIADGTTPMAKVTSMLARGSCRRFLDTPVPDEVIELLCATALASPTKSDLQQRDIVVLDSAVHRQALADLVGGQAWLAAAPLLVVFCGNNRRQRLLHDWRGVPFANDHLDALFNAAGDAAIALGAFVTAAEAIGLGCCPISAVRNEATRVSELLGLPDHVFPFAGLAIGYPVVDAEVSLRLPLKVTCHKNRYSEDTLRAEVAAYDEHRARHQPYASQRLTEIFGTATPYTWSEDKVRQYSQPERADFGAFLRRKGFQLE